MGGGLYMLDNMQDELKPDRGRGLAQTGRILPFVNLGHIFAYCTSLLYKEAQKDKNRLKSPQNALNNVFSPFKD